MLLMSCEALRPVPLSACPGSLAGLRPVLASQHFAEIRADTWLHFQLPACEQADRGRCDNDHSTAPTRDLVRRGDVCSSAAASGSSIVPAGAPPTCSRTDMGIARWSKMCLGLLQMPKVPSSCLLPYTSTIACPPWQEPCQAEAKLFLDLGAANAELSKQRRFSVTVPTRQRDCAHGGSSRPGGYGFGALPSSWPAWCVSEL